MNEEQKLKLAQAKSKEPDMRLGIFDNNQFNSIHNRLEEQREAIVKLLDKNPLETTDKKLTEVNNSLIRLIQKFEINGQAIEKSIESQDESQKSLTTETVKAIENLVKSIPTPKLPEGLATDKSLEKTQGTLSKIDESLEKLVKAAPQSQKPEDFVPFRRVVKQGNRLEFDDSSWASKSGGGGAGGPILVNDVVVNADNPLPVDIQDASIAVTLGAVDTELPAAAALADGASNPTTPTVGAGSLFFNGTTWDRAKSGQTGAQSSVVGMQNTLSMGRYNSTPLALTNGQSAMIQLDAAANVMATLATLLAGEDQANNVMRTEQQFSYKQFTTSTQVKGAAGFLHAINFSQNDAAPTAGTIDVYDNPAGTGTKIWTWTLTTTVFMPFSIILDVAFTTGLYVNFTTTSDVSVTVSYR